MRSRKADLEGVRRLSARWRADKRRRLIPAELWRAATGLLDGHSPTAICRRLRLSSSRFKEVGEVAMSLLPHVAEAEYRGDHRIHLWFDDGREKTVDFAPWLRGPVFEPLEDAAYFRRFFLEAGTVTWPNGADIAPETLYEARGVEEAAWRMEA